MKTLIKSYTFIPMLRTIAIHDVSTVELEQVLLIVNKATNTMIYNFADPTTLCTIVDNTLTLSYDTSTMNSSDPLHIYLDLPMEESVNELYPLDRQYTHDLNLNNVLGSAPLFDGDKLKTKNVTSTIREVKGRLAALNESLTIQCDDAQTVAIQIANTYTGTLTFEGSVNGGDFVTILGINSARNDTSMTTTGTGVFQFNAAGLRAVRVRYSIVTSGAPLITMVASSAISRLANSVGAMGSQNTLLTQRATSFELTTYDTNLATLLGGAKMWRDGLYSVDYPIAPTINPTRPTVVDNKFATYPQLMPRIRVEVGGDKRLPLAQEDNTNKLLTVDSDVRRVLEEILVQIQKLNQNFTQANSLGLQQGNQEVR